MIECAIVEEPSLIPLELLPGDVGGMVVVDDERPILGDDAARPPLDPGLLAGQDDVAGLGPSIDIRAGVCGFGGEGRAPSVVGGDRGELAAPPPAVMTRGEAKLIPGEI